jgi:Dullard-like phosphatase family protein
MNLRNNYHPVHSKDYLSQYLYSNSKSQDNNPLSIYLSSNLNQSKQKIDFNSNNYAKRPLNLDLGGDIINSLNDHKNDNTLSIRHYSSFSYHNLNNRNLQNNKFKKTLILDLDETLVHSAFTPFSRKSDFILNINIEGENKTLYVLKRPYVDKFLYELSLIYEIIIFTASISQYANPLLDQLDKNNYIKYRLFREHCIFNNGIYIKDLKIFDRKINNMIIIDNNPLSYDNNIENGIPILSWYDNMNDNELLKLLPLLKYMSDSNVQDVRIIINQIVDRNKNEIDYIAINKILNAIPNNNCEYLRNQSFDLENKYRKNNKSQEPKNNISKSNEFNKNERICDYNNREDDIKYLKNNYIKNNDNESRNYYDNKLFNSKFNQNNCLYHYNNKEERENEEINIDKMDPSGIRKSIFAPEEYNVSSTKALHYSYNNNSFNNNIDDNNRIEENKNDDRKLYQTMKIEKEYLNNIKNSYDSSTISYKNEKMKRPLTPNILGRRKNELLENKESQLEGKISKKNSLVELTIKALHFMDDENQKKKRNKKRKYDYETINNSNTNRIIYKYNNYFRKENEIIYNDYINNNKYIGNYKSNNSLNKNTLNRQYFNNFNEESKNINDNPINNKSHNNNKMIISKKIDSFNERFMNTEKLSFKNRAELNNENYNNKILERINKEKINNFLNNNKNNVKLYQTGNNFYNIYLKNYIQDSYYNSIKKSYAENKNDLKSDSYKKEINLYKNDEKNNLNKETNNNRYDLLAQNNKKESLKSINNHNNSSNNLEMSTSKGGKKSNKNDEHHLVRSSSYIDSNSEIEKILDKFSSRNNYNYDKENYNSNNKNYNIQYGNNLNYKYELLNIRNKPKFAIDNIKYYNSFNRTSCLK